MKASVRYALVFTGTTIAGMYLHEFGHAVAGWMQGIPVVPTLAREYILLPQVYWNQEIWVSLGGPVGTALAVLGATLFFLQERRPEAEAALLAALLPPGLYTLRFLLTGRGHDGWEWQAAQTALGLAPAGHAIDLFFLCLWLAGIILWGSRLRFPLRYSLLKFAGLFIAGVNLLVALQVANNRLFDCHFSDTNVANDSMPGYLYHNKGNGTFEEVALLAGVGVTDSGRTYAGMGVDFADYNNEGLPDLAVADLALDKYALYENVGKGFFQYATDSSGLGNITEQHSGMGLHFIDYDNDGRIDLLASQGHVMDTVDLVNPNIHYREPMFLARNTGKGFVDVSAASGDIFHQAWPGRGLAVGDINNDGRMDAVVSTSEGPAHILLNQTATANHWLMLKLTGNKSNRDAIGAEVKVVTARGAQYATVTTASSYLSASDKRVHFGLGPETTVQKVEIRWSSGILQTLSGVKADQILAMDEPR